MILTGKALEDFNKWNYDNDFGYIDHEPTSLVVHFEDLDEFLRNAIIIEWFDEKGIYISIEFNNSSVAYILSSVEFSYSITTNGENYIDFYYKTRREATEQAIKKANEIYNLKFGD